MLSAAEFAIALVSRVTYKACIDTGILLRVMRGGVDAAVREEIQCVQNVRSRVYDVYYNIVVSDVVCAHTTASTDRINLLIKNNKLRTI